MASHPSVTRCDVSAPYRHIVTSRHTPLRGVTDVTCDAGSGIIHFADGRTVRSHGDRAISVENINDLRSLPSYRYRLHHARFHLRVGKRRPRSRITRSEVCVPSIRRCPKRTGTDRVRVEDMDVKLGEPSGVDAPRKKITFLAPAAFRGFLWVRGCAPEFPFFFSPPGIGPGLAATPFLWYARMNYSHIRIITYCLRGRGAIA